MGVEEGAGEDKPLPSPRRPRFMILAGVTGDKAGLVCEEPEGKTEEGCALEEVLPLDSGGCVGGGIDKSTGDGVSPTISPITMLLPPDCA